jgi:hypothetical protein
MVDLRADAHPVGPSLSRAESAIGSLVTERSHHVLLRSRQWSPRAYSLKGQVLENCLSVTIAVPFGMLGCAGSRRASRILGGSQRLRMRLAAAHDLAPASAAGECKQPLVHSMGLIRLIETFGHRLRGLRRAIILEGSQGSFPGRGRRARPGGPSAGRGWPGDSA